jgi:hypothetical protein
MAFGFRGTPSLDDRRTGNPTCPRTGIDGPAAATSPSAPSYGTRVPCQPLAEVTIGVKRMMCYKSCSRQ